MTSGSFKSAIKVSRISRETSPPAALKNISKASASVYIPARRAAIASKVFTFLFFASIALIRRSLSSPRANDAAITSSSRFLLE